MNYVEALLVAEARAAGRAVRSALVRHVHLTADPMAIVLWQLGAEPFTAAAVAWGFGPRTRRVEVPGEPRDRELAFRALGRMAAELNPWFEVGQRPDGGQRLDLPQLVLPNRGNLTLLRRLGRRLAFLPTSGPTPADPELVKLGKHLVFLGEHARTPGQGLVIVLTDLLGTHWATELSPLEAQSLPALDAWIAPPRGQSGFEAAAAAEGVEIGPAPGRADDEVVDGLVTEFNRARARSTDEAVIAPLRAAILAHYQLRIDRAWPLIFSAIDRERRFAEAAHASRRWEEDASALEWHLDWVVNRGGHLRTRYTHRRAALKLKRWEEAQTLLEAERALDDPLVMVAAMLNGEAIAGRVVAVDDEHREVASVKSVRRPVLTVDCDEPCTMPTGRRLWWTGHPKGAAYELRSVSRRRAGSRVQLCLQTGTRTHPRPGVGDEVVFSVHVLKSGFFSPWPDELPWTHQQSAAATSSSVEDPTEAWEGG